MAVLGPEMPLSILSALRFIGGRVEVLSSDTGPTDLLPCYVILNLNTIRLYPRWGFLYALCKYIASPSLKKTALFFRGDMPGRGSLIRLSLVIRGIQGQNQRLGGSLGCINVLYYVDHSKENDWDNINGVKKAANRSGKKKSGKTGSGKTGVESGSGKTGWKDWMGDSRLTRFD